MPRSNPSSVGYARGTQVTTQLTARETFGGPAKAGLGRHIGMGQFTYGAIINGNSGSGINKATTLAGPSYPMVAGKTLRDDSGRVIRDGPNGSFVRQATDLFGKPIYDENGNKLFYPINFNNQIGGVSNPSSRYGPTRAPADGVNFNTRMRMAKSVAYWNRLNPARPIRGTLNPSVAVWPTLRDAAAAFDAIFAAVGINNARDQDATLNWPDGYDRDGTIANAIYIMYNGLYSPQYMSFVGTAHFLSTVKNAVTNATDSLNSVRILLSDPHFNNLHLIINNLITVSHFLSSPGGLEAFYYSSDS